LLGVFLQAHHHFHLPVCSACVGSSADIMLSFRRITYTVSSRIMGFYIGLQVSFQENQCKCLSSIGVWARPTCTWPNCTACFSWPHGVCLRLRLVSVCRPHRRSRQAHGNDHTGGAGASAAAGPATAAGQVAHSPEDVLTHQLMLLLTSAHRGFTSHEAMTQLTGDVIAAAVRAANQANADGHPAGSQPPVPRQPASYSPSDPIPSPPISVSVPERDFLLLESVLLGVTAAQAPNTLRPPSDVSGSQGSRSVSVLPDGPAAPVGPVPSLGRGRGEGRSRGSYNEPSQMGAATAAAASQPLDLSLAAFPPLGHQPSRGAAWSTRPTPQGFSAQPQANQLSSEAFPELAAAANAAQPAASRQRR